MQAFNFEIRKSATPSMEETRSRYIPSSIYSGPGPAEEFVPPPPKPQPIRQLSSNARQQQRSSAISTISAHTPNVQRDGSATNRIRHSTNLNVSDPMAMHLLMETAIADSREFEILSYEELEQLKHERGHLRSKLEGQKRQLALEKKMLEAAQSLSRLHVPAPDDIFLGTDKRVSYVGRNKVTAEITKSNEKLVKLTADVERLEERLRSVDRKIMQHTAGILQFTHKGLKKNVRRNELPRSPESMASNARDSAIEDFDERSLYQVPQYVHEIYRNVSNGNKRLTKDAQPIEDVAVRLHDLNLQVHNMIQQAPLAEHFEPPPEADDDGLKGRIGAQIQAYLTYMSQGLDALTRVQERVAHESPAASAEQMHHVTEQLAYMMEKTQPTSNGRRESFHGPDPGHDLQSRLAYSSSMLESLNSRVDALLEQKNILTRQIQQQRELNTKSDAQRDGQIRDLTEELEDAKHMQTMSEKEMQQSQDQIHLLMEQLDRAQKENQLRENQRGMNDSKALEAERQARKAAEDGFNKELESRQHALTELQADHAKAQRDFDMQIQSHTQRFNEAVQAQQQAELERSEAQNQHQVLQSQIEDHESRHIELQTELTMARAELEGAYGSRAQRAQDISTNPEIKKQIDDLNQRNMELMQELSHLSDAHESKGAGSAELQNKVNALQRELKDTIEDYEVMTKASIEFEKERDQLETKIDELRDKCDAVEGQLQEDKVKWLGVKQNGGLPSESTSTIVLKNEFRRIIKESRTEALRVLRAEQDERKRLERLLREVKPTGPVR